MPFIDSFADAQTHLGRLYLARPVDAVCFELDAVGPRTTTVRVELLRARGRSWLAVSAAVGPEADCDAASCLRANGELFVGALAIDSDVLWMRTVVPLATTTDIVDAAVGYVTEKAAELSPAPTTGASTLHPLED